MTARRRPIASCQGKRAEFVAQLLAELLELLDTLVVDAVENATELVAVDVAGLSEAASLIGVAHLPGRDGRDALVVVATSGSHRPVAHEIAPADPGLVRTVLQKDLALCRRGALLCCPPVSPTAGGELPQLLVVLGISSGSLEELGALGLLPRARDVLFFYAQSPSDQPEACAAENIEATDHVARIHAAITTARETSDSPEQLTPAAVGLTEQDIATYHTDMQERMQICRQLHITCMRRARTLGGGEGERRS